MANWQMFSLSDVKAMLKCGVGGRKTFLHQMCKSSSPRAKAWHYISTLSSDLVISEIHVLSTQD